MSSIDNVEKMIIENATVGMTNEDILKFNIEYHIKRKNPWITLWLGILFGVFGVHQFYLGYPYKGFSYLSWFLLLLIHSFLKDGVTNIMAAMLLVAVTILVIIDMFTFIHITKIRNMLIALSITSKLKKMK